MDKKEVQAHYSRIAGDFTDLSNTYCNSRYQQELEKHIRPADSVLEVGCGTGLLLSQLKAKERVGIDYSPDLLKQLEPEGVKLIQADAESLPFPDQHFDIAYSVNVLEHVPHPDRVVSDGLRVLKQGGNLVVITPNGDIGWILEIADALHLKAPEGPHRFVTTGELRRLARKPVVQKKMVLIPSGPRFLLKVGEKLESIFQPLCFFHLLIVTKE